MGGVIASHQIQAEGHQWVCLIIDHDEEYHEGLSGGLGGNLIHVVWSTILHHDDDKLIQL